MSEPQTELPSDEIEIDLRDANIAAFLAWLWPGAGHLYQRRYAKGVLFMVCVLSTWFCGLTVGGGRVVYAAWNKSDWRWQYVCQLGVGAPALPALIQAYRVKGGNEPFLSNFMAPPHRGEVERPLIDGDVERMTEQGPLANLHKKYHAYFEIGTLYTVIAGLLNVLAVYDAYAGPVLPSADEKPKPPDDDKKETK